MRTRTTSLRDCLPRVLLAAVCLLVGLAAAARAQGANQWRALAPIEGGTVNALLSVGERLYAATTGRGVFVSTNLGQSWSAANNGLLNLTVTALGVAGGNVLAVTSGGIYRSTDGGQNWTEALPGPFLMRSLMVTSTGLFVGNLSGRVLRSTDNGQTWSLGSVIPNNPAVYQLVMLGDTLFAATSSGVFRSTDQGQNWVATSAGLPNNNAPVVNALAISGNTLYAGTAFYFVGNQSSPQVYSSTDNGQNWTPVGNAIVLPLHGGTSALSSVVGLTFDGANLQALTGAGIAVYNGQQWMAQPGGRGLPVGIGVNALIRSGETTFIGTGGGVFERASDGQSWLMRNSGLTAASVVALAVSYDTILASAGQSGLFRSTDDGQSWTRVNGIDNGNGRPFLVVRMVVRGGEVYAGAGAAGGVFRSTDKGVGWTALNSGFRPTGPSIAELIVSDNGDLYAITFSVLYKLNAEGTGWTEVNTNAIGINRLAASGTNIYATTASGVLRSTDGGLNFTPANVGSPITGPLAIAARGSNVYFGALTNNLQRVFVSTNHGESFTPSQSSLFPLAFVFKGDALYAGTNGSGVFYSTNNGLNWTPINAGLLSFNVNALAVKGDTLLAGVNFYGVLAATNPEQQPALLASVSAASFRPNEELAPGSIATAFGTNLSILSVLATGGTLPTTLAGTRIIVRDSGGVERPTPLFFVSPGQINYQVPPQTAPGPATVIVISGSGITSLGNVTIVAVAPGLFAANANGMGVAAAVALRIKADGTQTFEPIATLDPTTRLFVARPLDLGAETDQVFLVLYGTGIRLRSALSAVTARIAGLDTEVVFAGAAPGLVGADQINVRLPRQLIGRGEVEIVLTVDGKAANTVRMTVR